MIDDIKVGWKAINPEPLIAFPLAILIVGILPVILELFGIQSPWSDIISSILAALLTAIEILRVRGRMEKTAIDQGRRWHRTNFEYLILLRHCENDTHLQSRHQDRTLSDIPQFNYDRQENLDR